MQDTKQIQNVKGVVKRVWQRENDYGMLIGNQIINDWNTCPFKEGEDLDIDVKVKKIGEKLYYDLYRINKSKEEQAVQEQTETKESQHTKFRGQDLVLYQQALKDAAMILNIDNYSNGRLQDDDVGRVAQALFRVRASHYFHREQEEKAPKSISDLRGVELHE